MRIALFVVPLLLLLLGCNASSDGENSDIEEKPAAEKEDPCASSDGKEPTVQYGTVLFVNESGYRVSVHADAFSGPVIADFPSETSKSVSVRPSDNYGIGSVFAIVFKRKILDGYDLSCGEIYAYGIDPNMQFSVNVEAGKNYTLQIPKPSELVFETAFIQIDNASSNSFELTKNSMSYKQAGNGVLTVGVGEIGVYEIPASTAGTAFEGYRLKSVFKDYDIPSFNAVYNRIYKFSFDGFSVEPKFNKILSNNFWYIGEE